MTVSPIYSDDGSEQQVVDLEISTGHNAVGRDGQYRGWQDDYTPDSHGRYVFEPKGIDELAESPVVGFDEESYTEALLASNPDIPKALEYAVDNAPQDFVDQYNAAVDAGDLDLMHKMLDEMLREYNESKPVPDEELEETVDEEILSDEEATEFAQVLDDLTEQQPGGTESAYVWLEASQDWKSDPVMSAVCRATAAFHDGSSSAEDLIDSLTAKFTPRELARAYKLINGQ